MGSESQAYLSDLSGQNQYRVSVTAVTENIYDTQDLTFYMPQEVNGEPAQSRRTKTNAHAALYETERIKTMDPQMDNNSILRLQNDPEWREPSPTVHPMLISAGQKYRMSVDSSPEHGMMLLNCYLDGKLG